MVTELVYASDKSDIEKVEAIIEELKKFPDATRHFLYGFKVWDMNAGEQMGTTSFHVHSLTTLLEALVLELKEKEKKA